MFFLFRHHVSQDKLILLTCLRLKSMTADLPAINSPWRCRQQCGQFRRMRDPLQGLQEPSLPSLRQRPEQEKGERSPLVHLKCSFQTVVVSNGVKHEEMKRVETPPVQTQSAWKDPIYC